MKNNFNKIKSSQSSSNPEIKSQILSGENELGGIQDIISSSHEYESHSQIGARVYGSLNKDFLKIDSSFYPNKKGAYFSAANILGRQQDIVDDVLLQKERHLEELNQETEIIRQRNNKIGKKILDVITRGNNKYNRELVEAETNLRGAFAEKQRIIESNDWRQAEIDKFDGENKHKEITDRTRAIAKSIRRHNNKDKNYEKEPSSKLNLAGIEYFDEQISEGCEGIDANYIELEGGFSVKVYNLNGIKFRFLASVVGLGYESNQVRSKKNSVQVNSLESIVNSLNKTRIELSVDNIETSEYISTSLITDRLVNDNLIGRSDNQSINFGYSELHENEVIGVSTDRREGLYGDTYVINNSRTKPYDYRSSGITRDFTLDEMAKSRMKVNGSFNEIAIDRYDDHGSGNNFNSVSRKPDFLVSVDNMINQNTLNLADMLKVPIVNVRRDIYMRNNFYDLKDISQKYLNDEISRDAFLEGDISDSNIFFTIAERNQDNDYGNIISSARKKTRKIEKEEESLVEEYVYSEPDELLNDENITNWI